MITREYLKEILEYNPETGVFTWKNKRNICGTLRHDGYIRIRVNKKFYYIHKLAWLYVYGEFPISQLDHINGNRSDNRIENLRIVTPRQNSQNKVYHRQGHLIGTHYHNASKKWMARIRINGKQKYLGLFETKELAYEAYLKELEKLNEI